MALLARPYAPFTVSVALVLNDGEGIELLVSTAVCQENYKIAKGTRVRETIQRYLVRSWEGSKCL